MPTIKISEKEKEEIVNSNVWPVLEAKRILERIKYKQPEKGYVLFETGYGPSGLPHIGTFGEVVRTSFVRLAFTLLAPDIKTRLFVLSDDFDGMRKVPSNVPNQEMLKKYIGIPLTQIPDPFGERESYGHYMNNKLCEFLNNFGFEYEFLSATKCYKDGVFDEYLKKSAQHYQDMMDIMLPTLGEERQKTYSPFMPIDMKTGRVLESGVISVDPETEVIKYYNSENEIEERKFTSGGCKLQWKCDFGMRWAAFDVDYEIYGKDHYPNEKTYRAICQTLGRTPPVNYFYEMFLDEEGKKISKSKGNGIEIEDWLRYATKDVLALYMFQKPKVAKRLSFDVIPKTFDEYLSFLSRYQGLFSVSEKIKSPIFFVHSDTNIPSVPPISFLMLLNLASTCNPESEDVLWGFLKKYDLDIKEQGLLKEMIRSAITYYNRFILPNKKYKIPSVQEAVYLERLKILLGEFTASSIGGGASELQQLVYKVADEFLIEKKLWFELLYSCLLGLESGPRFGSFIEIYSPEKTILLIEDAIKRK